MPIKAKWNEVPCPECKEPIAQDATICPYCRTQFSADAIAERVKLQKKSVRFGCGALIALALLLGYCAREDDVEGEPIANEAAGEEGSADPAAGSAKPDVKAAMVRFNDKVMTTMKACDTASSTMGDVATRIQSGQASLYDAYNAASEVVAACETSWNDFRAIKVPDAFSGSAEDKAEETIETCGDAAFAKRQWGSEMQEVFDGNVRPSKIAEAQRQGEAGQAGTMLCVARLFETAGAAGVDPKEFAESSK